MIFDLNLYSKQTLYWFIGLALLFFGLMFTVEQINGRFWLNDFKVMYGAADALVNDAPVYGVSFGLSTGFYKYSPFTLLGFIPFTWLPYGMAAIFDFWINAGVIMAVILLSFRLINTYVFPIRKPKAIHLFLVIPAALDHLVRELHLGNTNMILTLLILLSLTAYLEKRYWLGAIFLAIVVLTKPYFMLLILPLLLVKAYQALAYFFLSLTACVAISFVLIGFSKSLTLYANWFKAMLAHSDYLTSSHTLSALASTYFNIQIPISWGIPILCSLAALLFLLFYYRKNDNLPTSNNTALLLYSFILIALVPSLLITDTEHFLFSLPLVIILINYVRQLKSAIWTILLIVLLIFYGGNSSDIFGRSLSNTFMEYGLLGISNIIIIIGVLTLYMKQRFNSATS